jgi:CheY-like chemotaxis protein
VSQESEAILVVEDEADVRSYLVETLRDLNYRVRGASDGSQALAQLSQLEGKDKQNQ